MPSRSSQRPKRQMGIPFIYETDSYVAKKASRPFHFPKGTRSASTVFGIRADGWVDWSFVLQTAVIRWREAHDVRRDEDFNLQDLFVTIAFTDNKVVVEVSDRLRSRSDS